MEIKYVDSITEKISDVFYVAGFRSAIKKYRNLLVVIFGTITFLTIFSLFFPKGIIKADGLSFYVEVGNPSCNDGGPGSEAVPFCTIQAAADTATFGDFVYVKAGSYPERVTISSSGTSGSHIRFETFNSDLVNIQGGVEITGDYIDLDGFLLTDEIGPFIDNNHGVLDFNGATYSSAINITIEDILTINDGFLSFIGGANHNLAENINADNGGAAPHYHSDSSFNTTRNSSFIDVSDAAYFQGQNNLLENTRIRMKDSVDYNTIYYPNNSTNNTIRNCELTNVHIPNGGSGSPTIFTTFAAGDMVNLVLENNIFGSENVTGWGSADPDYATFVIGRDYEITGPVIIRNNVIFGGDRGSLYFSGAGTEDINNFQIYNNLFYGESDIDDWSGAKDWSIRNNIFYGPYSGVGILGTGSTSDYNMYVGQNPTAAEGSNSFRNDSPQFTNPDVSVTTNYGVTADWRPILGSPLINAGLDDTYNPTTDKSGAPRDTSPDIGPFEYRNTYYVDVGDTDCSDDGYGSQAIPFCSIQEAVDKMFSGATVHVAAGSYGNISIPTAKGGVDGSPTRLLATGAVFISGGTYSVDLGTDGPDYLQIDGFTLSGFSNTGIRGENANNLTIINSTISSNPASSYGIFIDMSDNVTISGNHLSNIDRGIFVGISSGSSVNDNELHNLAGDAIIFSGVNNNVFDNTVYDNSYGAGILLEAPYWSSLQLASNNNRIYNNILWDNYYNIQIMCLYNDINDSYINNTYIYNNLIYRDNLSISRGMYLDAHQGNITGIDIYNNTIVNTRTGGTNGDNSNSSAFGVLFGYHPGTTLMDDVSIKNNIFYFSSLNNYSGMDMADDYNIFYWPPGETLSAFFYDSTEYYINQFSSYQSSANAESHGLVANPLFVSSTDFHLLAGSSAIDSGVSDPQTPSQDMEGNNRYGAPDIGVFEYIYPNYTVSTLVNPGGSGSIMGGGSYSEGSNVNLTANSSAGYTFTSWSGDCSGSANPFTITNIQSNKSCTANFIIKTYEVSASASSGGSVSGMGTYNHGSTAYLLATAGSGYNFSSWSGDCSGSANPFAITNIQSTKSCMANFQAIPPPAPPADNTAPTITVVKPGNYDRLSGSVEFEITASDVSGIEYIALFVDGIERVRSTSNSLIYILDTEKEDEEFHDVKLVAADTKGNTSEKAIIIFIDNVEANGTGTTGNEQTEKPAEPKSENTGIVKKVTTFIQGVATDAGEAIGQVVSDVAEKAEEVIINTPEPVARAFPYLLFALILFTGAFFSYQAYQEYILGKKLNEVLEIQKVISSEKDSFLNIASHYLRTPLTIIINYYALNKIQTPKTLGDIEIIKNDTEDILKDVQDNIYLKNVTSPKVQKPVVGYFSNPFVWISAISVLLISILANYVYTAYQVIDLNLLDFLLQMIIFLLVAAALLIAYRYRRNQQLIKENFEKSLDYEEKIDQKRNEFIEKTSDVLSKDIQNLENDFTQDKVNNLEIRRGMQRLKEVITKFGLITSMIISKELINNTEFSIEEVINKILAQNEEELLLKNIKLEKNIETLSNVVSDRGKIEYVIASLFANAIKFGDYNSTISINAQLKNQNIMISIKNTGKVITEEGKLLLFKPFTQASESYDLSQVGMGLSLYLSRLIINYLGGDISLESNKGVTEVVAMLPNTSAEKAANVVLKT